MGFLKGAGAVAKTLNSLGRNSYSALFLHDNVTDGLIDTMITAADDPAGVSTGITASYLADPTV